MIGDGGVMPWRERIVGSIARSRKIRGGNYVQLASVDTDGAPHVRTVVFRGFAPDGSMKMITDSRSEKVQQSKRVEVCERPRRPAPPQSPPDVAPRRRLVVLSVIRAVPLRGRPRLRRRDAS